MIVTNTDPSSLPLIFQLVGLFAVGAFWGALANILPAILGIGGGLFGGNNNATEDGLPVQLDPTYPFLQENFGQYLSNYIDPATGAYYGHQAFPGAGGPAGSGSQEGPGTETIGQMSPDVNNTILPNVYQNWQPWDAGTQYLADFLYNQNPVGQEDPRARQLMDYGGFGGPGHSGVQTALQYGAPSEAGQYLGNLAQFGVTGTPMGNFMKEAMAGSLNPHRKVPVPPRG